MINLFSFLADMNGHMWVTFLAIFGAIVLFAYDRIPIEVTAAGTVAFFLVFFHFFPFRDAGGNNLLDATVLLRGFANPVIFAIFSLLVIGQGLFQTGAVDAPSRMLARLGRDGPLLAFIATLLTAGITSAFLNNTPVVIIFIPIVSAIAANIGYAPGRTLMPLSFICILGGMTTLIGSSANLIAVGLAEQSGVAKIGFFDFAVPGLFLASLGALYVLFVLPLLLRKVESQTAVAGSSSGRQFISEIRITPDHPWIGMKSVAGLFPGLKNVTVRMILRGNQTIHRPFDDVEMKEGDLVSLAATRQILTDILAALKTKKSETTVDDGSDPQSIKGRGEDAIIVEAAVSPNSTLHGRTIRQRNVNADLNYQIIGVQRQRRMLRRPLKQIELLAGDVLLLLGSRDNIRQLRRHNDYFLMEWSAAELPKPHHSRTAVSIFALTILLAGSGLVPIAIAAFVGALAMVLTGCITIRQAFRAIDRRIFLLIGAAFAMAEPLRITGGAAAIAHLVVEGGASFGPAVTLSLFFLIAALMTNFLSNQATAALLAPVAVSTAAELGVAPEPFVYGLIFALNCSFATPIAYQTNLIVMGPGNYQFKDYLKGGLPLILIIWLAYSLFAPFYFDL